MCRGNLKFLHLQPRIEEKRADLRARVAATPEAAKACKPLIKCSSKSSCSLMQDCVHVNVQNEEVLAII